MFGRFLTPKVTKSMEIKWGGYGGAPELKDREKVVRYVPGKPRRPTASADMIYTCENPENRKRLALRGGQRPSR